MNRKKLWLGVLLGAVVFGLMMWRLERSTRPEGGATEPGIGETRTVATPASAGRPGITDNAGLRLTHEASEEGPGSVASDNAAPTVGDILAEPDENYVRVAGKLLKITLNPRAPMEEREEALAHALNLSAGNEAEVLIPLIKDKNLPEPLAETVLAEALNRPLDFQADLYLTALGSRGEPELKTKIREHLAFLTGGDDLGPNPADWQKAIAEAKAGWVE